MTFLPECVFQPGRKQKIKSAEEKVIHGKLNGVATNFLLSFRHGKQIISLKLKVWILYV